jgi:hypothetical protein
MGGGGWRGRQSGDAPLRESRHAKVRRKSAPYVAGRGAVASIGGVGGGVPGSQSRTCAATGLILCITAYEEDHQ